MDEVHRRGLSRWSPRRTGMPALADWWPAYFLVAALAALAVLVVARLLVDALAPFAHVIVVAGVAAVLTFALVPIVGRLEQVMPRPAAAAVVFFGALLTVLALAAAVVLALATEGARLTQQLDELGAALDGRRALGIGPYALPEAIQERVRDLVVAQGELIAERGAEIAAGFVTSLIDLVLILVVTFYLLLDARRFRVIVVRSLDPSRRPAARRVFVEVAHVFGAYVRAQLVVALSLGVLVTVAMLLIGVPYAIFLGIFAALAELVPMVGPFVGAIPALLVALTLPFPTVLWVALAFLVIQQLESNALLPRLSAHAVGIHPIGSILALIIGFEVGGVVGALFAVPIAGLLWVLLYTAVNAWRGRRQELHRTTSGQAVGWPDGRPGSRAGRALRQLRPR
ncbi:MAG TPA: AI-2E family transporter [Candidatus Limnocylindria bacterium]|nr:AI-2E family transporter [Candidatus Limnocylindria bacterium]